MRNIFQFKKFSPKQMIILEWWKQGSPYRDFEGIIADGAVRSGKTVSMSLSFVIWAMTEYNGCNFAFCGKTIGSLRRNVIQILKVMLWTRGFRVKDHRSENCLEIKKGNKVNLFYVFGGKDESSQDLIQGITLAGIFFDEVALMPESFVNQGTARCSIDNAKLWFNCNPEGPYHWFKQGWIDKKKAKKIIYLHFTMDDNLSLSENTKARYRRLYSGIFFKRYILGLWVLAEGVIYDMFNIDKHIRKIENHNALNEEYFDYQFVSCDYGTQNPCTYGLYGVKGESVHLIRSYYYDGRKKGIQKSDSEYAEDMVKWLGTDVQDVKFILVDPSAASFIAELTKSKYHLPQVMKAKNDVDNGIRMVMSYLNRMMFTIDPSNTEDIREFQSYLWDEKASNRGEEAPIKENDHCMDRNRYAIYTVFGGNLHLTYSKAVYAKGKEQRAENIYHKIKNKGKIF